MPFGPASHFAMSLRAWLISATVWPPTITFESLTSGREGTELLYVVFRGKIVI